MPLWDCFKALAEGFVAQPLTDRPVGLSNIRATSDDDLLNQLSNPVDGNTRFWTQSTFSAPPPAIVKPKRGALKPTMAFAHLHHPVVSGYQYFANAGQSPVRAFSH